MKKAKSKKMRQTRKIHITSRYSPLRLLNFLLVFGIVGTLFLHFTLAATAGWYYPDEANFVQRINSHRASIGQNALSWSGCITNAARAHAKAMSDAGRIYHSNLGSLVTQYCGNYGYAVGENVGGFHSSTQQAWDQYLGSLCHRGNIESRAVYLNSDGTCRSVGAVGSQTWSHVGLGVWKRADGTISSVQIFVQQGDGRYGNFNQAVNANPSPSYGGSSASTQPAFGTLGKTPGYAETFVRGTDNKLYHKYYNNGWSGWEPLDGTLASSPSWISWGKNRVDVFARGTDGALYHKSGTNNGWSGWENLGGKLTSAPAVASWGENRLDVFARGTDNAIYHKAWDGSRWHDWKSLGGSATSSPAAASMNANRINVFARGNDGALYTKHWDGGKWNDWQKLGGQILAGSSPTATSMGNGTINAFAVGTDKALYNIHFNGSTWGSFQSLGGTIAGRVAATSWGANRIDVFARGTDGAEYHKWWDGANWYGSYEPLGGQINGASDI